MRSFGLFTVTGLISLFIVSSVTAAPLASVEFSAETHMWSAKGESSEGHVFVGNDAIRTEMTQNGQQLIQVINTATQVTWVIRPAQRAYIELHGKKEGGSRPNADLKADPCQGIPDANCQYIGEEKVLGREAKKWDVTFTVNGRALTNTQWIDMERGILLRQEADNGPHMEQRMIGMEKMEGRTVEKWEMTISQSNKKPQRSYRWFDPVLNLAIREECPGVFVREIKNIRIGKQDARLFVVPAGFNKVEPQSGAPARR
ncbi:hypothetical protein [Candidatus Vondammii sp. HM_W22]|uniref:hypothetical protein n=1 Tax=Candidatus Vondammii sp. HM_W22 TaxID=2687299 RepID=UPI001F13307B|nr:hypothetical protein [Candidatus Vondammii sp. HM_W22]